MTFSSMARRFVPEPLRPIVKRQVYHRIPLKWRMGRRYWELRAFLQEAQWWDRERIEAWQLERLKSIVRHAYANVPGYRSLYQEAGVGPDDIISLASVRLLPFTTKELLRDNPDEFAAHNIPSWRRRYVTTGGSTGIPLGFYHTDINTWMESAFMHTGWNWAGWQLGDTSAVLRGSFKGSTDKLYDYDPARRELLISAYLLSESTYEQYMRILEKYSPKHLQAYPSMATVLADFVLRHKDVGRLSFKTILLGSENIFEWQKSVLVQAFPGARVFGWYGHTEQAIFAPMCEMSDQYHVWPFYGLTEIVSETDEDMKEHEVGELIGTSFWSDATPFIRYRTMDLARYGGMGCSHCGRQFPLLEGIVGRANITLVLQSGRRIPLITSWYLDVFTNVSRFQFYQDTPGKAILRIMRKSSYSEQDTLSISRELHKRLGEGLQVTIEFVDEIPRTQRGKHQLLVQKLDP